MTRSAVAVVALAVPLLVAALATPVSVAARSAAPSADAVVVNRGVVELETGGSAGITVRLAEDLANVIHKFSNVSTSLTSDAEKNVATIHF